MFRWISFRPLTQSTTNYPYNTLLFTVYYHAQSYIYTYMLRASSRLQILSLLFIENFIQPATLDVDSEQAFGYSGRSHFKYPRKDEGEEGQEVVEMSVPSASTRSISQIEDAEEGEKATTVEASLCMCVCVVCAAAVAAHSSDGSGGEIRRTRCCGA